MDKDNSLFADLSKEECAALKQILENLYRERGVDFRQYRPKCLRRRLTIGMYNNNLNSFAEYLFFLKKNPEGYEHLLETIAINVSEFFRNPETFEAVREKIVPEIIKRKKNVGSHIIRIWSAGCATGEEPYSIAIMFKEVFENDNSDFVVNIFATDIDKDALAKAEKGSYSSHALKNLIPRQKDNYFIKASADIYQIKPELKTRIKFMYHNMINDPPLERIDLLFCRNVVIYFSKILQQRVYENFHQALVRAGYMVAGKVETLIGIAENLFERVDLSERIFKKKESIKI